MNAAIVANRIKPVVDEVQPLEMFRDALEKMRGGGHFGKIVLSMQYAV
jgi:NADPH:quinone reductase-like Zn-dependent oxidoreductase